MVNYYKDFTRYCSLEWFAGAFFFCFSFLIFSSAFPTCFSANFSTLAIILMICFWTKNIRKLNKSFIELSGYIILFLLLISLDFNKPLSRNLAAFSEYRLFLILPFITSFLLNADKRWVTRIVFASGLGCLVSLIGSYGLWLGLIDIEGAQFSFGNRIFHAFTMVIFLAFLVSFGLRVKQLNLRIGAGILAFLCLFNLLLVEQGRTGYLATFSVCAVFCIFYSTGILRFAIYFCIFLIFLALGFFISDDFVARIAFTFENFVKFVESEDRTSSLGLRLSFYETAVGIMNENFWSGVGLTEAEDVFFDRLIGQGWRGSDNVHSEFLTMGIIGGIWLLVAYMVWVFSFFSLVSWH